VALGGVPVDNVPEGRDVVRTTVLVVQVVRMLPDIEADDGFAFETRDGLAHQRAVLVGRGSDGELLVTGDDEPRPAGAEAGRGSLGKLLLEGVERSEGRVDRLGELALRGAALARTEDLPEKGVIAVPAG